MKLGKLAATALVALSSPLFLAAAYDQNEFATFNFTLPNTEAEPSGSSAAGAKNDNVDHYETFALFVFQSFFDNISAKILPPLLKNLDYFTFGPFSNDNSTDFDEDVLISYEIENIKIHNASIDPSPSGVVLSDDNTGVTVGFKNLTFSLEADYSYITEPPILADIGQANIHFANTTFFTDIKSELIRLENTHKLQLQFSNQQMNSTA